MAVITPKINRIYRMNEFDLLTTNKKLGNMYMCLDTQRLYYDETDNKRVTYGYTGVNTINDLMYYITPAYGTTYYCWEDNSLWLWNNKWVSLYTDVSYPSAYVYDDNRNITDVYNGDQPYTVLDNNGLLKDGSVVIRDRNRIIKGKLYIEQSNDNMVISSYLGGGIRILPNGKMTGDGELFIGDVPKIDPETGESVLDEETGAILYDTKATVRASFSILNNEGYVDYSETPETDPSEYPNTEHKYEIFHSGNLDVSAIKVITPQDIYTKLQDPSLPSPLDLNVKKVSGHSIDEISLVGHKHVANDITDFNSAARDQALVQVNDVFSRMTAEGITVTYNSQSRSFRMTANPFNLIFTGGASGSALVNKLTDTSINLEIDGSKHHHTNYEETMVSLQDQIDAISSVDPENYYNKIQVDEKISSVSSTDIPTAGKPLKVNNDLILPGTSASTNALANAINISLTGDITGSVSTDLSGNVSLNTSAYNILSQLPEEGKALMVNANGDLPGNAQTSSALDHILKLIVTGEAQGTVDIDTSLNQASINLTLAPGNNIVQSSDLGVTVATLGQDGKLTPSQLPATQVGLVPMGNWNPQTGAPSNNPIEGQFWIANTEATFNNKIFQVGDWCLYYDSAWNKIDTNDNVLSVNGLTGNIILTASDVRAIDTSYINYTIGNTIPQNKIVITSGNGTIEGASVSNLTSTFAIESDNNSDVEVSSSSSAPTSDGSTNFGLKLDITQTGYQHILQNAGYTIQNNGVDFPYKNKINFVNGITVTQTQNGLDVGLGNSSNSVVTIYWDGTQDQDLIDNLNILYKSRATTPIILFYRDNRAGVSSGDTFAYLIDGSYANPSVTTIIVSPDHKYMSLDDTNISNISVKENTLNLHLTFVNNDGDIVLDSITTNNIATVKYSCLTTDGVQGTTAYIPVYDSNPATKKYVDDKFTGFGKYTIDLDNTSTYTHDTTDPDDKYHYEITHNLDTMQLITVFRNSITGEQLYLDNIIVNNNKISVELDQAITTEVIDVVVYKM